MPKLQRASPLFTSWFGYYLSRDSLIASRMSAVVAFVSMPSISKGDLDGFINVIEKASPVLLLITTSSLRAMFKISEKRCLASEYEYTFIIYCSKRVIPMVDAVFRIARSRVINELRVLAAHSKK